MTKKNKIITVISICIVLTIFLFLPAYTSKKIYSPDKQYSVYAKPYMYSELLCVFSFKDCWHQGKVYLYDEVGEKVLESAYADTTEAYEAVSWSADNDKVFFKGNSIDIPGYFWYLPRPIKEITK